VKNEEGITLLLIQPDLAALLKEMALDCKETSQGSKFTLEKAASGS